MRRATRLMLATCALTVAALIVHRRALAPSSVQTLVRRLPRSEISIIQTHGAALPVFQAAVNSGACPAGATVVHVDKHDDMQPPQILREAEFQRFGPDFREILGLNDSNASLDALALTCDAHCNSACRCVLQNNNFITTAVMLGLASHVLWLYPDFHCAQCAYERVPLHQCELLADNGDLRFRPSAAPSSTVAEGSSRITPCGTHIEWDAHRRVLTAIASESPLLSSSRGIVRTRGPTRYSFEACAVGEALGSQPPRINASSHRPGSEGAGWILDFDLDFLVPDNESPRMRNLRHQTPGTDESEGAQLSPSQVESLFDKDRLASVRQWACAAMPILADMCDVVFLAQLTVEPPQPPSRAEVARRLSGIEMLLTRHWGASRPPCAITVARSLEGGYTPIGYARLLEEETVAMVRRVFHRTKWAYSTARTVDASVLSELSDRIDVARLSYKGKEDGKNAPKVHNSHVGLSLSALMRAPDVRTNAR